jgi:hypothetical protein
MSAESTGSPDAETTGSPDAEAGDADAEAGSEGSDDAPPPEESENSAGRVGVSFATAVFVSAALGFVVLL